MRKETNNTLSATSVISRFTSVKPSAFLERPCLRIQMQKQFNEFILDDLQANHPLGRKLYNIRKSWILFTANRNYFETSVHKICITNYKIEDGLLIMIVSAVASRNLESITFLGVAPFIKFSGKYHKDTECMIKAWNEFAEFIKVAKEKNLADKVESYTYLLSEYLTLCEERSLRYIKKSIKAANEFIDGYRQAIDGINSFLNTIKTDKALITQYATQACGDSKYSADQIVHSLISQY